MGNDPFGSAALRRIEWLTLLLGGVGAAWAGWRWGWRGSVGLAVGAVLSWVNFRWLKGSVQAFEPPKIHPRKHGSHCQPHASPPPPAPPRPGRTHAAQQ